MAGEGGLTRVDALVVGCGAMGSSTSYNLAKKGCKVVAIDRFQMNHEMGSSHGQTRIIRLAYYEDPRYVPMLRRAFESWREAEARSGRSLLRVTGGLMIGRQDGELVTGVLKSAKLHSIPCRMLSAKEVEEEFEAFVLDDGMCGVHESGAGVLFPEECISAYVNMAKEEGCTFRFGEQVTSWKSRPEGVEVEVSGERYMADKLVLCAGAWTRGMVNGLLPLTCERQVPFWFSSGGEERFGAEKMPIFISEEGKGVFYYGLPDVGRGVKVARTHGGEACEPDRVRRDVTKEDSEPVERYAAKRLRKLPSPAISWTTCLYTNTPDLNFAVGAHPKDPRVIVVSACSGHGFKFASVMGEIAADLALEGKSAFDTSFIGLERFAK